MSKEGIAGNIVKEPAVRFADSGKCVINLRVALDEYPKPPETTFIDVVAFGPLAENAAESFGKGTRIVAVGTRKAKTWTGRDGTEHNDEEFIADAIGPELRFATVVVTRTS